MKKNMEKLNSNKIENSNAHTNDIDHLLIVIVILIHCNQERITGSSSMKRLCSCKMFSPCPSDRLLAKAAQESKKHSRHLSVMTDKWHSNMSPNTVVPEWMTYEPGVQQTSPEPTAVQTKPMHRQQ